MPIFMLDTNAFNFIGNNPHLFEKIVSTVREESVTLCVTHIQRDEIDRIPNSNKDLREKLRNFIQACCIMVPTSGMICGISRVGECRISDGEVIEAIRKNNLTMSQDALIGATAKYDSNYLVTDDKILRKWISKEFPGVVVLTNNKFEKNLLIK